MFTLKEKLYQMFILGTDGGCYIKALQNNLGGIIFFSQDIQTETQFKQLVSECNNYAKTKPFLSIDQEGGRVERTENIHSGKKYLSAKFAYEKGTEFLINQTESIANEIKNYGLNLNFAPCVDVNTNPNNPIIGERAFANNTQDVILGGKIVAETYRKNGIIPCAKHFPGHGDANTDSHLTLPEITLSQTDIEQNHIKPFQELIKNGIEMIMVAHLDVPFLSDAKGIPTSLSQKTVTYLRKNLAFDGILISDDMIMKGVSKFGPLKACEMGIRAGLDMFIYRNSTQETINLIDNLVILAENDDELRQNIEKSFIRIQKVKNKFI